MEVGLVGLGIDVRDDGILGQLSIGIEEKCELPRLLPMLSFYPSFFPFTTFSYTYQIASHEGVSNDYGTSWLTLI